MFVFNFIGLDRGGFCSGYSYTRGCRLKYRPECNVWPILMSSRPVTPFTKELFPDPVAPITAMILHFFDRAFLLLLLAKVPGWVSAESNQNNILIVHRAGNASAYSCCLLACTAEMDSGSLKCYSGTTNSEWGTQSR
jgi:hypothetical protein